MDGRSLGGELSAGRSHVMLPSNEGTWALLQTPTGLADGLRLEELASVRVA